MLKIKKILLLIIVVGLVFVLLGAALLWFVFPSNEWIRGAIESKIAQETNTQVTIGDISVGFSFPGPVMLKVSDVRAFGSNGAETLVARKIELTPSLINMLKGMVSVSSIHIEGVRTKVILRPDGSHEYPFVPVPVSSAALKTIDAPNGQGVVPPSQEPKSEAIPSETKDTGLRWSIDKVRADDVLVELIDMRTEHAGVRNASLSFTHIDLTRANENNSFEIDVTGKANSGTNNAVIRFAGGGPVKLNSSLSAIETANLRIVSDRADLAVIAPLVSGFREALEPLALSDATAKVGLSASSGASVVMTGLLSHIDHGSNPLKINTRVDFSPDLTDLINLETTIEGSKTPLAMIAPLMDHPALNKGNFSGSVSFRNNYRGEWSARAGIRLQDLDLEPQTGFKLTNPSVDISLQGTQEKMEILEFNLEDKAGLLKVAGTVAKPWDQGRTLDLRLDCLLKSASDNSSVLSMTPQVVVKGPLRLTGSIKGSQARTSLDFQADITQGSVEAFKKVSKKPDRKGILWFKGFASSSAGKTGFAPAIEGQCGIELVGVTVSSGKANPVLTDLNIEGASRIEYGSQGLELRKIDLDFRQKQARNHVAKLQGDAAGLTRGSLKMSATLYANVDPLMLSLTGIDEHKNFRISGHTIISARMNQTTNSYSYSVEAPLKNLDISYDGVFRKKTGMEGLINASGTYSKSVTKLGSGSLSLPGLSVNVSGAWSGTKNHASEMYLKLRELDFRKAAPLFPDLAGQIVSGKCRGEVTLKLDGSDLTPKGLVQFDSVLFKPDNSMITFESMAGSAKINGANLNDIRMDGKLGGFIEAPVKLSAQLQDVSNGADGLKGQVAAHIGKGVIRLQRFKGNVSKPQAILGTLVNSLLNNPDIGSPEFSQISGDFTINAGFASTDNLRQVGGDLKSAMIGSMDLRSRNLDAFLGIKALINPPEQIGKIPAVKELVKKHEGLLKITGLDKELKRFGIDTEDQKPAETQRTTTSKTPVNIIFRVTGKAGEPNVSPVLENSLGENVASKLRALTN